MPNPLIECIPNFSEARRPEVVEKILQAIESVDGVNVLDRHSDLDHNRTVITMVGSPQAIVEAAFQGIRVAQEKIDMDLHQGAHPRLGATDVVPFVPISDVSMADCIELARNLGKRVGEELSIPVYLYEEAATRPERQNLENIRKGQYEGLKDEIGKNPDREPDYGPAILGKAGATVIGARAPLIAFNIYLSTAEVSIAQKIAKAVRHSSGGLRYVKAMGVLVDGMAQVSMNLTNHRQTPIARVVELVRREAARYGIAIHHSELVGLIPQQAMIDAAVWYTQLDNFLPDQVLEHRIYENQQPGQSEENSKYSFLDELAAETPTPGGGSAAAFTAAEAAALVAMVARVTVGKKKYVDVELEMKALIVDAEKLKKELIKAVSTDADSFERYLRAVRLPKNNDFEIRARDEEIIKSTLHAASVPRDTARLAIKVMELGLMAARMGNINAISDAASAVHLASAAVRSALLNVRINLASLAESENTKVLFQDVKDCEKELVRLNDDLLVVLNDRASLA